MKKLLCSLLVVGALSIQPHVCQSLQWGQWKYVTKGEVALLAPVAIGIGYYFYRGSDINNRVLSLKMMLHQQKLQWSKQAFEDALRVANDAYRQIAQREKISYWPYVGEIHYEPIWNDQATHEAKEAFLEKFKEAGDRLAFYKEEQRDFLDHLIFLKEKMEWKLAFPRRARFLVSSWVWERVYNVVGEVLQKHEMLRQVIPVYGEELDRLLKELKDILGKVLELRMEKRRKAAEKKGWGITLKKRRSETES